MRTIVLGTKAAVSKRSYCIQAVPHLIRHAFDSQQVANPVSEGDQQRASVPLTYEALRVRNSLNLF